MTERKGRRGLILAVASMALAGSLSQPLGAQTTEEELAAAKKAVAAADRSANAAAAEYEAAHSRLVRTQERIERTRASIDGATERIGRLQGKLAVRAREAYQLGTSGTLELLLEAESFTEFSDRMVFLDQLAEEDADLVLRVSVLSEELRRRKTDLALLADRQADTLRVLEEKKKKVYARLAQAQALRDKLARRLAAERAVLEAIIGGSGSTSIIPGAVLEACPVPGSAFVDSWGEPRSGGRRHEGVDMMAPTGTPVYAGQSGTVGHSSSSLGGISAYVYGDGGDTTFYAHLSGYSDVASGTHVSSGTLIGYVGDSGNAAGTPHVHFEYHPGGGAAVNPYPYALAAC